MEGEVGYFRRNHLVPVPKVKDLAELNEYLLRGCQQDEQRRIAGKPLPVGEAMRHRARASAAAGRAKGFELAETSFPDGGRQGLREGADEPVLDAAEAGDAAAQARLLPAYVEDLARAATAWRGTSAASGATSRCWIWSIIWTCWNGSRARWRDRRRCSSGGNAGAGRRVSTGCGRACSERHGQAGGHAGDDRVAAAGQAAGLGAAEAGRSNKRWRWAARMRRRCAICWLSASWRIGQSQDSLEVGGLARYERPLPVMNEYDQLLATDGSARWRDEASHRKRWNTPACSSTARRCACR